jgi:hypothetical protein
MEMNFLIANYMQKYTNIAPSGQISKCWRLTNEHYSRSAGSMVRVIRAMMPDDMTGHTYDEIMEMLYNEDDALLDFL